MRRAGSAVIGVALLLPALGCGAAEDSAGPRFADGASFFQANCVVCHGHDGIGLPGLAPPLTEYPARYIADAEGRRQLAMTVLYGMFGDVVVAQQHYSFKMPDFARFPDDALAAALNYIAFDLGHAPPGAAPLTAAEIAAERAKPATGDAVRQHRTALLGALGL